MQPWKTLAATVHLSSTIEGWTLATPAPKTEADTRTFRVPVAFGSPFDHIPVVHVGLTGFDLDQRDSSRLRLNVVEISTTGFVVEISTWRETRVYAVDFSWLALGA